MVLLSSPTDTNFVPALFQRTPHTESVCSFNVAIHSFATKSQIFTLLSLDPVAKYFASGLKCDESTHDLCPVSVVILLPDSRSYKLIVASSDAVTSFLLSLDKFTVRTLDVWPIKSLVCQNTDKQFLLTTLLK